MDRFMVCVPVHCELLVYITHLFCISFQTTPKSHGHLQQQTAKSEIYRFLWHPIKNFLNLYTYIYICIYTHNRNASWGHLVFKKKENKVHLIFAATLFCSCSEEEGLLSTKSPKIWKSISKLQTQYLTH